MDNVSLLIIGIATVFTIAIISANVILQRRRLARQNEERFLASNSRNWTYQSSSIKDETFSITGEDHGVSWCFRQVKDDGYWGVTWSTNTITLSSGIIQFYLRESVLFHETFSGRLLLRLLRVNAAKLMSDTSVVTPQNAFLHKNYALSVPKGDEYLAHALFDTEVTDMIETFLKIWPDETANKTYANFFFRLSEEGAEMRVGKKIIDFEIIERFIAIGFSSISKFQQAK